MSDIELSNLICCALDWVSNWHGKKTDFLPTSGTDVQSKLFDQLLDKLASKSKKDAPPPEQPPPINPVAPPAGPGAAAD